MGDIPIAAWTPIGALCLVLATPYLLMARGRLLPKSTHDEIVSERDHRIVALEALNANLNAQNRMLLESAIPTVNSVLGALHRAAAEGDAT